MVKLGARLVVLMAALATGACGGSSEGIERGGGAAGAGGDGASGGSAGSTGGASGAGSGGQGLGGGGGMAEGGAGGSAAGTGAAAGSGGASAGAGGAGAGGAGAGGAGAGGAGAGGAGAGGGGGAAGELGLVCRTQIGYAQRFPDPDKRETTTGTNGTFTDECDAQGKLVEYYCAYETRCDQNMTECAPYPTGQVTSRTTECMFVCGGGACMYPAN